MNSQNHNVLLQERYLRLSSLEKEQLGSRFRKAPLMQGLIRFLEEQQQRSFTTRQCIQKLYGAQSTRGEYSVIENRFFKLRKKLLESLSAKGTADTAHYLDEELEFRDCVDLLTKGRKELAFKRLQELEAHCWNKNLFELLPRVIDRIIFCNQSFNRGNTLPVYERYDEAVRLNTLILQVLKKVRQIYDINYQKGIAAAKSELRFLKKTADLNARYPRFHFIYHHLSLYYKLSATEYLDKMQVLGRHHAAVKRIFKAHGNLPVFYTPNYEYHQEVHLKEISMFYHYNKGDFAEAYEESCALKNFTAQNNSPRAESFFYNAFRAELAAGKYEEAKLTLEEYAEVLRKNGQHSRLPFTCSLQMILYVYAYPRLKPEPSGYTQKMFSAYLRAAKKNQNLVAPYEELLVTQMLLNYIRGRHRQNQDLLLHPGLKTHLESPALYQLYTDFIRAGGNKEKSEPVKDSLKKRIQQLRYKVRVPNSILLLGRLEQFMR